MNLTDKDTAFIERRRKLVDSWPFIGTITLVLLIAFAVWLWITRPLLVDPWAVFAALQAGTISESTMLLMAGMLPIATLGCILLMLALMGFGFVAFANEKRHIKIIQRLSEIE